LGVIVPADHLFLYADGAPAALEQTGDNDAGAAGIEWKPCPNILTMDFGRRDSLSRPDNHCG
jgi:hypothetical protein